MLGKRQRSQAMIRRTTSMASMPSAAKQGRQANGDKPDAPSSSQSAGVVGMGAGGGGSPAPRSDLGPDAGVETAAFLKACGICNKGLGPGKDTYIYRGEVAFCSQECRDQLIELDELMEQNCSLTSIKEAPAGGSDQSGSGGDAVAAA